MKQINKIIYVLLAVLLIMLSSIVIYFSEEHARVSMSPSFVNALKYLDKEPNKTVDFLRMMATDTLKMNEAEKNYYLLYKIYANDKMGIGAIPVGQTAQLVDFYARNKVDSLYMFSLYLHAGAFRDAQDVSRAVEWYLKAIEFGKKRGLLKNRFFERSFGQIASCYNRVFLADKALEMLKEAEGYVSSDYIKRIYSLECSVYFNKGNYVKARDYALKSLSVTSPSFDSEKSKAEYMDVFIAMRDTANIRKYSKALLSIQEDDMSLNDGEIYMLNKALYYGFIHKEDSACFYYRKLWDCGAGAFARQEAAKGLYQIYNEQGDDVKAWKYVKLYQQLTDSVMLTTESQKVAQVENLYNYQQWQKHANEELRQSNTRLKWALGAIGGLLTLMLLGIFFVQAYRKNTRRKLEISRKEVECAKLQSESLNDKLICSQMENNQIQKDNSDLAQEMISLQKKIKETESRNEELKRMLELGRMKLLQDANAYLEKLKDQLNVLVGEPESSLWAETSQAVDMVYPQLKPNLQKYYPDLDLVYTKTVYFSCLNFGVTRIGCLTNTLPQSVVKRKNRMMEKIQKTHPELKIKSYADLVTLLHGKRKFK